MPVRRVEWAQALVAQVRHVVEHPAEEQVQNLLETIPLVDQPEVESLEVAQGASELK